MQLFVFFAFSCIALSFGSSINSENDSIAIMESMREQIKIFENEIQNGLQQQKLKWQLEVFQKWYESPEKCSQDLSSYIFNDWTVIYRRSEDTDEFNRKWSDYQKGFGNMDKDFFIGLDLLHFLTNGNQTQELLILLGGHNGNIAYAKYDQFKIGSEMEKYNLKELSSYSGTAGDSLIYHKGKEFSTFDQDNDDSDRNCAQLSKGGFWFRYCLESPHGMVWEDWHKLNISLKFFQMMIRGVQIN